MKNTKIIILIFIALLVLAACGGTQTDAEPVVESVEMGEETAVTTTEDNMDDTTHDEEEMAHDDDMAEEEMADSDESMADTVEENMMDVPAWQQIELTDARTGAAFTLADFAGQPVFVEPMATWCTNCRRQLGNVRDAQAQLGDGAVFIALSLETTISDAELAQYQNDWGFDWTFAVMTPELLQQLADAFGRSITSAPSTPHFIIRPDGTTTDLVTGIESAEQLVGQIQATQG